MTKLLFTFPNCLYSIQNSTLQSQKNQVDYQAAAYIAPRKTLAETNGNTVHNTGNIGNNYNDEIDAKPVKKIYSGVAAKPKWGGAEICPRCDKSARLLDLLYESKYRKIIILYKKVLNNIKIYINKIYKFTYI